MSTPAPEKVRPSMWWFALGGGLLVAAVLSGIGLLVWTLSGLFDVEGTVPADGRPYVVEVGTDDDRMLWVDQRFDVPPCRVVDTATGQEVAQHEPSGEYHRQVSGEGDWYGAQVFDPGSGRIEVTCEPTGHPPVEIEIGPAPSFEGFALGLVATFVVPVVLGLLGLVVLLVTGVLWSTRATTRR